MMVISLPDCIIDKEQGDFYGRTVYDGAFTDASG